MERYFIYVYDVIEHEAGFGQRPDGFICFNTEEYAKAWIKDIVSKRTNDVPYIYDTYEKPRWLPVSKELYDKVQESKFIHVNKLVEPEKPVNITKKITLEWEIVLSIEDALLDDKVIFDTMFTFSNVLGNIKVK